MSSEIVVLGELFKKENGVVDVVDVGPGLLEGCREEPDIERVSQPREDLGVELPEGPLFDFAPSVEVDEPEL